MKVGVGWRSGNQVHFLSGMRKQFDVFPDMWIKVVFKLLYEDWTTCVWSEKRCR